jgi:hypothetical protein
MTTRTDTIYTSTTILTTTTATTTATATTTTNVTNILRSIPRSSIPPGCGGYIGSGSRYKDARVHGLILLILSLSSIMIDSSGWYFDIPSSYVSSVVVNRVRLTEPSKADAELLPPSGLRLAACIVTATAAADVALLAVEEVVSIVAAVVIVNVVGTTMLLSLSLSLSLSPQWSGLIGLTLTSPILTSRGSFSAPSAPTSRTSVGRYRHSIGGQVQLQQPHHFPI